MDKALRSPIVLIGFGNQAKAWALNLRDSGFEVLIALRPGSASLPGVQKLGFTPLRLDSAELSSYSTFALLTPDHTHENILHKSRHLLPAGARLIYAHGFSVHKGHLPQVFPQWVHLLLAPKSIASELRFQYETQAPISGVYSVEHAPRELREQDRKFLLQLAQGLGLNVGPFETSFERETFADLFSEQSLLCSILPFASLTCYNMLREKGMESELAFLECWHELKLIADALVQVGPQKFFQMISPNALVGAIKGKDLLLDRHFQAQMNQLLEDIFQKKFYSEIESSDFEKSREDLLEFWKNQDLQKTFERMGPLLYPRHNS